MTTQTETTHVIDARGKRLGRVASEAASVLLGKKSVAFTRNLQFPVQVKIEHVSELFLPEKKRLQKTYSRYTGYPGGLRQPSMNQTITKKGHVEVVRLAVYGMLPNNKLRTGRMKRLTIHA